MSINIYSMKKIILILLMHTVFFSCAQTYPLNTYYDVPVNAYIKDLNNDLLPYQGSWVGNWDNKTFLITFMRIKKFQNYDLNKSYYKDVLVGKFKVTDSNGLVIYDNTLLPNENTKIEGLRFLMQPTKRYSLYYYDEDLCGMTGNIYINFASTDLTKLTWRYSDMTDIITEECPYYNANPFPKPLPENIILTKQ